MEGGCDFYCARCNMIINTGKKFVDVIAAKEKFVKVNNQSKEEIEVIHSETIAMYHLGCSPFRFKKEEENDIKM